MTSISNSRAGLKLHRENFAEFKEGVLGRMESKTQTTAKVIMMYGWVMLMMYNVQCLRVMMKPKAARQLQRRYSSDGRVCVMV